MKFSKEQILDKTRVHMKNKFLWSFVFIIFLSVLFFRSDIFGLGKVSYGDEESIIQSVFNDEKETISQEKKYTPLDIEDYDLRMEKLANNPLPKVITPKIDPNTGEEIVSEIQKPVVNLWPKKTVYPNDGAILPFNRIIAYYGNLYSKKMGVLGEYEEDKMLSMLDEEAKKWEIADPNTPPIKALHYIAVTAQLSPGEDGKHRLRMPEKEIDKVLKMAEKANAIVFLDIQVGFSNLQAEIPVFEKYLKMPNVHLGIDAEFSMKNNIRPGKVVGTFDATDINFAIDYLSKIVKENNLPPKVLVVHRYTQKMITNYQNINPTKEVQVVMHMDGWGGVAKKINTYKQFIYKEPVQFTGFKLFYKNDVLEKGSVLMTREELLKLNPIPVYIQYQ